MGKASELANEACRKKLQELVKKPILFDVPMKKHTTWKVGGPADCMVFPSSMEEVEAIVSFLNQEGIKYNVIGNGSNLLVADAGIRGVVIKMGEAFSACAWHDNEAVAEAGMLLPSLALEAAERSLSGLEFAAGIPGSIGGAVRMNAGAYGGTIGEYVTKVEAVEYNTGRRLVLTAEQLSFAYRESSLFHLPAIICRIHLRLPCGQREASMEKIKELLNLRSLKQPLEYPSCGSVFRNPKNDHAGRLIEMANLRGLQIGGAKVSKKHGNFIVNLGGAKAKDIKALILAVQNKVEEISGIRLEMEVRMLGDFPD